MTAAGPGRSSGGGAFIWRGLETASRQVLTLVLSLTILAFVTPHHLGVYSLSFSFVLVLALIVDVPIGDALIQSAEATQGDWNTGFTVTMAIAVAAVAVAWLLGACSGAPMVSRTRQPRFRCWKAA